MAHTSQHPDRFAAATAIVNRFRAAQCNAPKDITPKPIVSTAAFRLVTYARFCQRRSLSAFLCAGVGRAHLASANCPPLTGRRHPVVCGKDVGNP